MRIKQYLSRLIRPIIQKDFCAFMLNDHRQKSPHRQSRTKHLKAALKKIPGLFDFLRLCRLMIIARYRSEWLLKREKPDNLFQPVTLTKPDRYPRIFSFVRDRLSDIDAPRLLSFGCSTGEEVFTLRHYFPQAEILGIDINPRSIAICRKELNRTGDTNIRFELAGSPKAEPENYYDAIFCMAVLRHGELGVSRPEDCSHLIRFADFEKTVAGLSRILKPSGYLSIRSSNFRFADTNVASGFDVVFNVEEGPRADTPIYDRSNLRLAGAAYNDVVFRKKSQSNNRAVDELQNKACNRLNLNE